MAKAPAFQLYASDYYVDTNSWTVDEVGIYQRLLLTQWVNGGLPTDEKRLTRIAGCSLKKFHKAWSTVSIKFKNGHFWESKEGLSIEIDRTLLEFDKLYNPRLEIERQKQFKYRELQSNKGKLSALKRSTTVSTTVQPVFQPKVNSSSSSSSSKKEKNILSDEDFLASLKEKFTWVDFDVEMVKIDAWLLANPHRIKTRRFIVKWISKIEKPMQMGKKKSW